jgi:hypothetical protein
MPPIVKRRAKDTRIGAAGKLDGDIARVFGKETLDKGGKSK